MSKRKTELLSSFDKKDMIKSSKFLAGNTLEIILTDDTKIIRFHDTNIITITKKVIELTTGGWFTSTTKERINSYCPVRLKLWQENNQWFFNYNEQILMFYDGIRFDHDGTLLSEIRPDKKKEIRKLKREIKKFVSLVDKLEELPIPSSGDCWMCCMREVESKKPLGDVTKDTEHLKSHMEEEYLHGSLIYNALKEKHDNDQFIGTVFQSPEMFRMWRDPIKRALTRYLKDKLIPEVINQS